MLWLCTSYIESLRQILGADVYLFFVLASTEDQINGVELVLRVVNLL